MAEAAERKTPGSIDRIVDAATRAFAERGYDGASIKVIADKAGVSRALLHYHFGSKDALITRVFERMSAGVTNDLGNDFSASGPTLARLLLIGRRLFDNLFARQDRAAFLVELFAAANHHRALREAVNVFLDDLREAVEQILEEGAEDVDALPMPIDRLAGLVETWIMGLATQCALAEDDEEREDIFEDWVTLAAKLVSRA